MSQGQKPRFLMCICTGKCPGFANLDLWDFINYVRSALDVEYAIIHPQLCVEDGDRFLRDYIKPGIKYIIGGCDPKMQRKLFKDAFTEAGGNFDEQAIPLDLRNMSTENAIKKVKETVEGLTRAGKGGNLTSDSMFGIPREKIPWFPTIDYDKCRGCKQCFDSCPHGVYEWDEENNRPKIVRPYDCVVGCSMCAKICPGEAIKFPTRKELMDAINKLREQI